MVIVTTSNLYLKISDDKAVLHKSKKSVIKHHCTTNCWRKKRTLISCAIESYFFKRQLPTFYAVGRQYVNDRWAGGLYIDSLADQSDVEL